MKSLRAYFVPALMLLAVLLPTYGPWIDPGYGGLLPQHDHIYVGELNPDHHHDHRRCLLDASETRAQEEQYPQKQFSSFASAVISVPDWDFSGQYPVLLIGSNALLWLNQFDTLGLPIEAPKLSPHGIIVDPLEAPPRL